MDKRVMWEKMVRTIDLSNEPIPGKSLVEIVGNHAVLIENHCGVISYNTEKITVKSKNGCISVCGKNLCISKMSKEQMRIVGIICNVEIGGRRN